jgi:hypothetical protein
MSQPILLDCVSTADIPSAVRLHELVTEEHHVVLRFSAGLDVVAKTCLVLRLASLLPEFTVFDSGGSHDVEWITVKKVIAAEEVRANEAEFVAALRLLRQTASALATRLARRLGVPADRLLSADFETGWADRLRGLLGRMVRDNRLDREWSYSFHGEACRFENRATGQVVEVRLSFGTEFGVLDPYFFALFVKSTPALAHLARLLRDDFHDTERVFEILHRAGHLRFVKRGCYIGMALREGGDQPGEGIPPGAPRADSTTENDWDSCSDPMEMLRYLSGHTSDREFRLFLCAWCRYLWDRLPDEQCRRAVETGERFADGLASDGERDTAFSLARNAAWSHITRLLPERHLPSGTLDNSRLAILADALEEAGCTSEEILGHLRGPGPHVRGCWVVDLCLGKK